MPRMRPAILAGSKSSRPSTPSPVPRKRMGFPETPAKDRAAPPLESPSIFVRMAEVYPARLSNSSATVSAS